MITLYGIKNCDTMKKTLRWFDQHGVSYEFVDYKKQPPDAALAESFIARLGWETVINKRGTTWRKLDDSIKANLDAATAAELIQQQPSLIKRPIVATDRDLLVGYDESKFEQLI